MHRCHVVAVGQELDDPAGGLELFAVVAEGIGDHYPDVSPLRPVVDVVELAREAEAGNAEPVGGCVVVEVLEVLVQGEELAGLVPVGLDLDRVPVAGSDIRARRVGVAWGRAISCAARVTASIAE